MNVANVARRRMSKPLMIDPSRFMRERAGLLMVLLGLSVALVGCSVLPPPPVVEYRPGKPLQVAVVPYPGLFTLRSASGNVESTTLARGELIGFKKEGKQLLAVRGSRTLPLRDGKYAWLLETGERPGLPITISGDDEPDTASNNYPRKGNVPFPWKDFASEGLKLLAHAVGGMK